MRPYALAVLVLTPIATAVLSPPAEAHCFSRWYYPHPQKCWAGRAPAPKIYRVSQVESVAPPKKSTELNWGPPADIPDIPIDPFAPVAHPSDQDEHDTAIAKLRTELNGH